jgi:exosortase A-associated hydrolase 2
VVYIHPFADEMNKSRRMAALQARALALAGYSVLQIDLLGCGDSSGDFGDPTWSSWVSDIVLACQWLNNLCGKATPDHSPVPLWLWGLRAGCLLAVDAAAQLESECNFLFWQPPPSGLTVLQQFLRLKVAGEQIGGQAKGVMAGLRQQLTSGSSVEIAGYTLSPGLASGLELASMEPAAGHRPLTKVLWLEISNRDDASFSPASIKALAAWEQTRCMLGAKIAKGPAFWQTAEIEDAPALIATTLSAISDIYA